MPGKPKRTTSRIARALSPLVAASLVLAAAPGRAGMPMMVDPFTLKVSGSAGNGAQKSKTTNKATKKARRLRARQGRRR